jgi:hypothetical protein
MFEIYLILKVELSNVWLLMSVHTYPTHMLTNPHVQLPIWMKKDGCIIQIMDERWPLCMKNPLQNLN